MRDMAHGKHRVEVKSNHKAALFTTGALAVLGVAAATGSASAATDAQWDAVSIPEAGGDWSINHSGDGLSVGGLQFQNPSWHDALAYLRSQGIDTSAFPSELYQGMSNVPTRAQQVLAGEALLHIQGAGAWANGNAGGIGASMFDGGPTPASVLPLLPGGAGGTKITPEVPAAPTKIARADKTPRKHGKWKHTVRPGDTLYGITKRATGLTGKDNWHALYRANRRTIGADPDVIWPGQRLTLPWDNADADPPTGSNDAAQPKPPAHSAAYRSPLVDMTGIGDGYISNGGCISRTCGGHSGVDFNAPSGTTVRAVHAGTVIIGGAGAAYGNHVVIDHGNGVWTLYGHLSSINVSAGQHVKAGDTIGAVGASGNASGPHLHFEVRTNALQFNGFLDPVAWLTAHGIIQ